MLAAAAETCRLCFAGPPWYERLTPDEARARVERDAARPGFAGVWLMSPEGTMVAASWYDRPDPFTLEAERGAALRFFADTHYRAQADVIWMRETVVHPEFQGLGLATRIKGWVHDQIQDEVDRTGRMALLLTRMREDNPGIIAVNRGHGYEPTGIRVESSQAPGTFHEYWSRELTVDRAAAGTVS